MKSKDGRARAFHARSFSLRKGDAPDLPRASGDSGFVAYLSSCTHGATGWDWNFRMARQGEGWCFVSDGRLTLFVDEQQAVVPQGANVGDLVGVRMPRARENYSPHRFTLYGGQGGPVPAPAVVKYFLPVTVDAAGRLVEVFASKWADQLRFGLAVVNTPADFERADAAVLDVGPDDEPGVLRVLEAFLGTEPGALAHRGLPHGTEAGPLGLARAVGQGKADLVDGYGWRRSHEAVASGRESSNP